MISVEAGQLGGDRIVKSLVWQFQFYPESNGIPFILTLFTG